MADPLSRPAWSRRTISRKRGERGFGMMLLAVCLFVMLGALGLAIDLGRMFIVKNELQTFADASALAAWGSWTAARPASKAEITATAGPLGTTRPNGYNFDTVPVLNIVTGYSTTLAGTYDAYAAAGSAGGNGYRFISVTASVNVPLTFLRVLPGTQMTMSAAATAGQQSQASVDGLLPFAPDAHNPAHTKNFGLTPGVQYMLKWGNGNTTTCTGDARFTPPGSPSSEHGFVDIGEGNGNSNVPQAIEYGGFPNADSNPSSLAAGDALSGVPGNRGSSILDALQRRTQQDTDDTSATYGQYTAAVRSAVVKDWDAAATSNYLVYKNLTAPESGGAGYMGLLPWQVSYQTLGTAGRADYRLQIKVSGVPALTWIPYIAGRYTLAPVTATMPVQSLGASN